MDSQRSAKRRKLNAPHPGPRKSSSAPRSKATPITYSKKQTAGRKTNETAKSQPLTNGVKERSSAHDAWLEAKAKSQALRGKRPGSLAQKERNVDVYDDIDGANTHQSPLKKKPAFSTPVKKQLDPLRNQKQGASAASSPGKGAATLGFFKQFHQPKSSPGSATPKKDGRTEKVVNGVGSPVKKDTRDDAITGADETSSDEDSSDEDRSDEESIDEKSAASERDEFYTPESRIASTGKGAWKGWAYGEKPKKTFEDEVRELESAARDEAQHNEDEAGVGNSAQRRRNRTNTSGAHEDTSQPAKKIKAAPPAAVKRPQDTAQRKTDRKNVIQTAANQDSELGDGMDIDDSADDTVQPKRQAFPKVENLPSKTAAKPKPQQRTKAPASANVTNFSSEHLLRIQTVLLEKLTNKRPICLTNLDNEYTKVSTLVTQTVTAGESNSMLLIGARGSGKTTLVNQVLREQTRHHPDDFHVVRLNGFIHTDDKIALREIWRQLGREMELDDEESSSKNYADTLTTLLALFSHPAELGREQPDQVTKSLVFILDEFELFASHPRQTLLYNLFDIAQSRKAPIAVLGLTTRIDVAESLEKRVKSRFSHRYVHLGLAKSFVTFQEACKAALCVRYDELPPEEREQLGAANEVAQKLEKASKTQRHSAIADWNAFVERLLGLGVFTNHLRRLYYTTKSVPDFHASMLMPVSTIPVGSAVSDVDLMEHFTSSVGGSSPLPPDSKLTLLSSLSTLQLALLICAARLTAIHNVDTVPFAQAYEEYKVLTSKAKLQASASGALAQGAGSRVWSKDVAKGAWEDLTECGLVMEDGNRGYRVDVGLEEIGMSGVELGSWGRWCREI